MSTQGNTFLMFLSASCLLWNKGVGSAEVLVDDGALLKKVLEKSILALSDASSKTSTK